jgi:hypothetical protein
MSISAANPAGLPHVSLSMLERANKSLPRFNGGGELHPSCHGHASSNRTVIAVAFHSQCADDNFALERVCRFVSRLCSGTTSGLFMRPAAAPLLLRLRRPAGYGFPPNLVRKERRKDFSGTSANAELRHLGAWPTRFIGAPIKIGRFNKRRQSCIRTK